MVLRTPVAAAASGDLAERMPHIEDYRGLGGDPSSTAAILAGMADIASWGGGTLWLDPVTYTIEATLDNCYSRVLVSGLQGGRDRLHDAGVPFYGCRLNAAFAGTVLKHRTIYNAASTKNSGGGFANMQVYGNNIATRLLEVDSITDGKYDLFLRNSVGTEAALFTCGVSGTDLIEACDIQGADIHLILRQLDGVAAQNAHGVVLSGSVNANVSCNSKVEIDGQHYHGHMLVLDNADNNRIWLRAIRPGAGTGLSCLSKGGTAASPSERARANTFLYLAGQGGVKFEGTETGGITTPSSGMVLGIDVENGTPEPVIGTGCRVYWQDGGGVVGFGEHRRSIHGTTAAELNAARALRLTRTATSRINYNSSASHDIWATAAHEWSGRITSDGAFEFLKLTGANQGLRMPAGPRGKIKVTASGTTVLTGNVTFVIVDASAGNITLTLPSASHHGSGHTDEMTIKRVDASGNTVTVQRAGSDTIDGGTASLTMAAGTTRRLIVDGTTAWLSV